MAGNEEHCVTISTHNVNGYSRSKNFLFSQCDEKKLAIRAIQEHWLKPPFKKNRGVNQLRDLHPDFDGFGTSAMKKAVESALVKGRPYGGTGFLYNKTLAKCLKPLIEYHHERVTAMKLTTDKFDIILINAYMPYYNTRELDHHLTLYRETIGFIENIIFENQGCELLILGDFNCNIFRENHPYSDMIRNLMSKYGLVSCFDFLPNFDSSTEFTRHDSKTNSFTLIDGILISAGLSQKIKNVSISHDGDNLSDHCPVEIDLSLVIHETKPYKRALSRFVN